MKGIQNGTGQIDETELKIELARNFGEENKDWTLTVNPENGWKFIVKETGNAYNIDLKANVTDNKDGDEPDLSVIYGGETITDEELEEAQTFFTWEPITEPTGSTSTVGNEEIVEGKDVASTEELKIATTESKGTARITGLKEEFIMNTYTPVGLDDEELKDWKENDGYWGYWSHYFDEYGYEIYQNQYMADERLKTLVIPYEVTEGEKTYTVTEIGDVGFSCHSGMTPCAFPTEKFIFPNTIKVIGECAFWRNWLWGNPKVEGGNPARWRTENQI